MELLNENDSLVVGHSTYLKATIGAKDYDCLLDTGSEVSLLPAVLVDKSYITRTSQTLKAANGTTIPILGDVAMPIRVGQFETTVNGLVSEHVSEVMLGIDWLTTNGAVWDFDKSQICIGGRSYRLFALTGDGDW